MKKDNTLNSAKKVLKSTAEKVIKSTEETAEGARKIASDIVTKGNVQKTFDALKNSAKNVKAKATRTTNVAKKTVDKKVDVAFYVQYQGKEVSKGTILEKVYEEWVKSHKPSEIKTLEVYLKVEEDTAYCLINGEISIDLKLS
ncbi:DUF6465 family protein [Clostridium sp.]|uniref:DUF6465 family protein n=1 Tax=Clostridium sp. TaxID=1506 RepID=UPI001A642893|nr:DUF6465 family protein [Clostridium sp.]MBK5242931.1 hypothetical protein [Clostridium sp.]